MPASNVEKQSLADLMRIPDSRADLIWSGLIQAGVDADMVVSIGGDTPPKSGNEGAQIVLKASSDTFGDVLSFQPGERIPLGEVWVRQRNTTGAALADVQLNLVKAE